MKYKTRFVYYSCNRECLLHCNGIEEKNDQKHQRMKRSIRKHHKKKWKRKERMKTGGELMSNGQYESSTI